MKKSILVVMIYLTANINFAQIDNSFVTINKKQSSFAIFENGNSSTILISASDFSGVQKVAAWLQNDIEMVTSKKPEILIDQNSKNKNIIIIGTLGKSNIIDELKKFSNINLSELESRTEKFIIETVENPLPNVDKALVIVGSDKRGTIYGMLELSKQIGVSPWYWWADVAVKKKDNLFIKPGRFSNGEPKVKYRGIFLNDEAPALTNWAKEKFGGFNHK
ncbi:MAG: glycosyl hydrolase 115 family protein, partial [Ignavibacteriae bacterium]|nr:glycosyl hydrolase 115 family protein [Ignavibacteriota bacterium]